MIIFRVRCTFCAIALLLPWACLIVPSHATVVHALDVSALAERSDLIQVGRVTSIVDQGATTIDRPGGPIHGKSLLAVLTPDETLKGRIETPHLSFEFAVADVPSGIQAIPRGQYGIFFLRRVTSGYEVADPVYPFLPAVPSGRSSHGRPLDRVITKLGEVLTYRGSTKSETTSSLDALATIQSNAATETLHHALETTSGELRLHIAAKLVARNDLAGLSIVEDALLHPSALSDAMFSNLAGSLGGLKDPSAILALKRLLGTGDQRIIKGAAIALRQSGTADALEPLSHLLENGDQRVRYYAVVGMGEITRQDEWTPAFPEFEEHEAKYLSYWRDWISHKALSRSNPPKSD